MASATSDHGRKPRPADYERRRDHGSMGGPSADLDREDIEAIIRKRQARPAPAAQPSTSEQDEQPSQG